MDKLQEYKNTWEGIAKKLAYISFTNQGYEILSSRNYTHEDIHKFVVTIFAPTYFEEIKKEDIVDLMIRFTVFLGDTDKKQEITFLYNDKRILEALVNQIHNIEFGVFQQYSFEFGKVSPLELFDAEYSLLELLNLEPDD